MPVRAQWDNEDHTIIRYPMQDPWELAEYSEATGHVWTLIETVDHFVHIIVDFTDVYSFPRNLLSGASTTNSQLHPRQGLVIGVKVSPYLQTVVRIAARFFPRLGQNVFFTQTLPEAYDLIRNYEAKSL